MVERVVRYKDKQPLLEAYGAEAEIRSTLNRRVDLPSGGYLVFDYAEAFTVIDVNTGRFVGSRSRSSAARLEDTITRNNLEAVKEVVRQLRLRDIGGIIVIDFIDMANPKNRAAVEEALRNELERDRTKTYVVEISPLGLVEMTRQNVTDGPREVMTRKCPTCGGDGIVISEQTAALDVERRLRVLAAGSRAQAYRVEVAGKVASLLVGPGAERLTELEAQTRRRFYLVGKEGAHVDHFVVLAEGKRDELAVEAPVEEGAEIELSLGEVGLHDRRAGVGKLDGFDVCVADAATLVGKKVKVRIERVLDGTAYATVVRREGIRDEPITADHEAEKPTRPRRAAAKEPTPEEETETDTDVTAEEAATREEPKPKTRTRRGSRGGRARKKKPAVAATAAPENGAGEPEQIEQPIARIHVPDAALGAQPAEPAEPVVEEPSADGEAPTPKKKTRRGTRGGRNRKKRTAVVPAAEDGAGDTAAAAEPEPVEAAPSSETWDYVPMSEWGDEIGSDR
jgi:ribonuclease G